MTDKDTAPIPDTCSDCDECQFSWHDSHWHCGDEPSETYNGMILDNDIHLTVHENCPLKEQE